MNTMKTFMLMALLTALMILIGGFLGGSGGMMMAFIFAIGMNFFSYWFSDKIVLKMYRAKEISKTDSPEYFEITNELCKNANLPMPKLFVIENDQPNAFATGRNPQNAAVAVTTGILKILSRDELRGVIAHELAHIKNRDILIGTIAATFAGAISMVANMAQWALIFGGRSRDDDEGGNPIGAIVMMIVAPLAAMLIQMAISRSREFLADETGAQISRVPKSLANALRKLEYNSKQIPMNATPATAHMFIVNPLSGKSFLKLFSTHPPIEERIARLEAMSI